MPEACIIRFMQCELCQNRVDESNTKKILNMDICHACLNADSLHVRLKDRGFNLSYAYLTKEGMIHPSEDFVFDYTVHKLSSLGMGPYDSNIDAVLVHEGFKAKVTKIFIKEIQVGNDKFDPKVYIKTDTPDETGAFLRLSRVQEVVMKLIDMQSEINIHGAKVYVMTHGNRPIDVNEFTLYSGMLLHLLTEFSQP